MRNIALFLVVTLLCSAFSACTSRAPAEKKPAKEREISFEELPAPVQVRETVEEVEGNYWAVINEVYRSGGELDAELVKKIDGHLHDVYLRTEEFYRAHRRIMLAWQDVGGRALDIVAGNAQTKLEKLQEGNAPQEEISAAQQKLNEAIAAVQAKREEIPIPMENYAHALGNLAVACKNAINEMAELIKRAQSRTEKKF